MKESSSPADHAAVLFIRFLPSHMHTGCLQMRLWLGFKEHADFLWRGMENRDSSPPPSFPTPSPLFLLSCSPLSKCPPPPLPASSRAEQTSFVSTPGPRLGAKILLRHQNRVFADLGTQSPQSPTPTNDVGQSNKVSS